VHAIVEALSTQVLQQILMLVSAASRGDDEPPRHGEPILLKTNERLKQHAMILVPLEVSDGQDHCVTARKAEFSTHSLSVPCLRRDTVVYYRERGLPKTQIARKLFPGGVRDGDRMARLSYGPAQRDPSS
jgi:hypothetical protein